MPVTARSYDFDMYSLYSSQAAIINFPEQDRELMSSIWLELMTLAADVKTLSRCKLGYCEVLIAQQNFAEARAILQELYEALAEPVYLHRLAEVAYAAGDIPDALYWLRQEQAVLPENDAAAWANNTFSLALLNLQTSRLKEAVRWLAETSRHARAAGAGSLEGHARRLLGNLALERRESDLAMYFYRTAETAFARVQDDESRDALNALMQRLESLDS